jgi:hypothetical protein
MTMDRGAVAVVAGESRVAGVCSASRSSGSAAGRVRLIQRGPRKRHFRHGAICGHTADCGNKGSARKLAAQFEANIVSVEGRPAHQNGLAV